MHLRSRAGKSHDYRHITRNQSALLVDPQSDKLVTHDLIRFESLQRDFNHICEKIGKSSVKLPKLNAPRRWQSYRCYFNRTTRTLARELFKDDLERFGYEY